jgi:hypothetical protein
MLSLPRPVLPLVAGALAAMLLCCSEAGPPPGAPAGKAGGPPAAGEWKTWSHERKVAYMKDIVVPEAKPAFASWEPKRFPDLDCKTCHGASVADNSYKMPNPALPKLEPGKITELAQTNPKAFGFMLTTLVPLTAKLLGEPVWDHKTMSGFGCFKCHTAQK